MAMFNSYVKLPEGSSPPDKNRYGLTILKSYRKNLGYNPLSKWDEPPSTLCPHLDSRGELSWAGFWVGWFSRSKPQHWDINQQRIGNVTSRWGYELLHFFASNPEMQMQQDYNETKRSREKQKIQLEAVLPFRDCWLLMVIIYRFYGVLKRLSSATKWWFLPLNLDGDPISGG